MAIRVIILVGLSNPVDVEDQQCLHEGAAVAQEVREDMQQVVLDGAVLGEGEVRLAGLGLRDLQVAAGLDVIERGREATFKVRLALRLFNVLEVVPMSVTGGITSV